MMVSTGRLAKGAAAGLLATAPMTLVQLLGLRAFRQPGDCWAPRHVVDQALRRASLEEARQPEREVPLTVLAHFSVGAANGALYAVCRGEQGSSVASGVLFGLAVWAANYAGILPALGLELRPGKARPSRDLRLVPAHLVYGACLGAACRALQRGEGHAESSPGTGG